MFVGISGPLVPRIRRSVVGGAFLDGVNAAALALMAVVTLQLAAVSLREPVTVLIALVSAFALYRYRINSTWLILGGAAAGLLWTVL